MYSSHSLTTLLLQEPLVDVPKPAPRNPAREALIERLKREVDDLKADLNYVRYKVRSCAPSSQSMSLSWVQTIMA